MRIAKQILGQLDKAYATAFMRVNGELIALVAAEGCGPCITYGQSSDWAEGTHIWEQPGGTMNIVPLPGRSNEFYATQDFTPTFQAKESKIVHARCDVQGQWTVTPVMVVPYLHRFDVCQIENSLFLIACTLCQDKKEKDDWSQPGKVYIGKLDADVTLPVTLQPLIEGITKNHGFWKGMWNGRLAYLISGQEGVFAVYPPVKTGGIWEKEQLLTGEVSDMAAWDIDSDGVPELATIQPFHGERGIIYKYDPAARKFHILYEHAYEFGHVVWGGMLAGKPSLIIGGRKGNQELNCFQWQDGQVVRTLIDNTGGPSNIAVYHDHGRDLILAANRQIGEVALYIIQ